MATKKKGTGKTGTSRREFVKTTAAAAAGVAVVGAGGVACTPGDTAAAKQYPLQEARLARLLSPDEPERRAGFVGGVNDFAAMLVKDQELRATFLENSESVLLIRLYNENRDKLEPLTGPLDSRSLEGRLKKMIIAAELFEGVSGMDGVYMGEGEEAPATAQCAVCHCGGGTLGCCICHDWGWNCRGAYCMGYCCCCNSGYADTYGGSGAGYYCRTHPCFWGGGAYWY